MTQVIVIIGLMVLDDRFHRQPGQNRLLSHQHKRLPEPSHSSIAVGERVDEFKLVMDESTGHKRMFIGCFYPFKEVMDQSQDQLRKGAI